MNIRNEFLKHLDQSKLQTITIHDVTKIIFDILHIGDDNIYTILNKIDKEKLHFESQNDELMVNIFTSSYFWVLCIHAKKNKKTEEVELYKNKSYKLWNKIVFDLHK